MKRYILKTVFIFALILCLFALASCGGESVPETATETESETLTLSWESVSMTETETDSETATETETETETDTDTETETETETAEAPVVTESETEEEPPAPSVPSYDVTPPFFHYFVSKVTVYRGGDFELDKYISYIDDYDADVELTVAGRVNTSVSGEYILTLTLTDDAGNSSSSNMYVTVKDYVPPTTTTPSTPATPEPPMTFAEFTSIYKKNGASVGIDVSRWQGEIDFNKVAQAGCEFVIMRIGGYDDGVFEDMRFAENIKKAKAAGLKTAVASVSKNAPLVLKCLGAADKFDYVADAARVTRSKPAPDIFLDCARALGVDPADCIGVEDAQAGIEAIKAAGMYAVGINVDVTSVEPDLQLRSTAELDFDKIVK